MDAPQCRRIGFVAYGALGRGLLTGTIVNDTALAPDDIRLQMPRIQDENRAKSLALVVRLGAGGGSAYGVLGRGLANTRASRSLFRHPAHRFPVGPTTGEDRRRGRSQPRRVVV